MLRRRRRVVPNDCRLPRNDTPTRCVSTASNHGSLRFQIMEVTTLGALAGLPCPAEDTLAFDAVIDALDANFPRDWRTWEVQEFSFEDIFGDEISVSTDSKLRFAIPTADLARAFSPDCKSLSERRYRSIRAKVLQWPLGRALIYAPHNIMEKIHGSREGYFKFMNAVHSIKNKLTNRKNTSAELRGQHLASDSPSSSGHSTGRKRPGELIKETESVCSKKGSGDQLLSSILSQHMEMFNRILATQNEQNEKIARILSTNNPDLNESLDSMPDSTQVESEDSQPRPSLRLPGEADVTLEHRNLRVSELKNNICSAQRELAALMSGPDDMYDFSPSTVEAEPKVSTTDPFLLKQGIHCQRFGQEGWRNLRYAEYQKQFQASPAFCALKINNLLASVTPNWKSTAVLEKFDLTLGAITHGLLQQRKIFREIFDLLPADVKGKIGKDYLTADSAFKKKSDALLQYVCGRRAEVIEQRRNAFRVPNKALNEILHNIPPSDTHLFADDALSKAVKDCSNDDIRKLFPLPARNEPFRRSRGGTDKSRIERPEFSTKSSPDYNNWRMQGSNKFATSTPRKHRNPIRTTSKSSTTSTTTQEKRGGWQKKMSRVLAEVC